MKVYWYSINSVTTIIRKNKSYHRGYLGHPGDLGSPGKIISHVACVLPRRFLITGRDTEISQFPIEKMGRPHSRPCSKHRPF